MFFCRTTFISRFCATSTVVSSRTALPAPSARRTFCQEGSRDDGHRHRQPVGFLAHREVCGRLQKTVWRATFGDASPHPHVRPVTRYQIKLVGRPGLEPGTTGLKVHCECNAGRAFQHPPSPILARLRRRFASFQHRICDPMSRTLNSLIYGYMKFLGTSVARKVTRCRTPRAAPGSAGGRGGGRTADRC